MITLLLATSMALNLGDDEAEARKKAEESRKQCAELVAKLPGIKSVTLFGVGTTYRVIVTVATNDFVDGTRDAVGEAVAGTKVIIVVATPPPQPVKQGQGVGATQAGDRPADPKPQPAAKQKEETPRLPDPYYKGLPDCDIILEHYKVKPPSRWKEGYRCQHIRRSCLPTMGAGGWTYDYTKHRPKCPVRNGRCAMPADADDYVRWVFTKGFTNPVRACSFLDGFDLRGSDAAWASSAENDLRTRLPFIREKAEWTSTGKGTKEYQREVNRGAVPTPGAGMGWVPPSQWTPPPASQPTPVPTPGSGGGSGSGSPFPCPPGGG